MARNNIIELLGHPFTPETYKTAKEQFKDHLINCGYNPPSEIIGDGNPHKFPLNNKDKTNAAWYVFFDDSYPAGVVSDWKSKIKHEFKAFIGRELTPAEEMARKRKIHEAQKKREEALEVKHNQASNNSSYIWENAGLAEITHNYLKMKELQFVHGARVSGDGRLIIPLMDKNEKITSLQYISNEGGKQFQTGGDVVGMFWTLGEIKDHVYIAEGFATGATIREETDSPVVIAYNAGNLPPVAKRIREKYPDIKITIIADNDSLKSNTGEKKAREAAEQSGCSVIMPPDPGDINDYRLSGKDVKSLLFSSSLIKELDVSFIDELSEEYEPPDELIQNLLVKKTVSVVYGDSNSGKTFFCLSLARDVSEGWDCYGRKTEQGLVLYIATEAPGSIKMRLQAMKKHHNYNFKNIAVVKKPINLYQNQTDHIKIIELVTEVEKKRGQKVNFIIADTLAQISAGADENGVKDMSPIMQKFSLISEMTNTSILVIHHSGKDKSKGARGSSSIYAHVNTEIKVSDNGKYKTAEITKERELGSKGEKINYKLEIIEMGLGKFGNKQSTCVAIHDTAEHKKELPTKIIEDMQYLEGAWLCSGMEHDKNNDFPYITSSAWSKFLVDNGIVKNEKAGIQAVKKSGKGMATRFIEKNIIRPFNNGYLIIEDEFSTKLMLCRKSRI